MLLRRLYNKTRNIRYHTFTKVFKLELSKLPDKTIFNATLKETKKDSLCMLQDVFVCNENLITQLETINCCLSILNIQNTKITQHVIKEDYHYDEKNLKLR